MVEIVFTSAIHDTSLKFKVVLHSFVVYISSVVGIYIHHGGHIYPRCWIYMPNKQEVNGTLYH